MMMSGWKMDLQLAHFHCLKKNMFRRMCFNVFAHTIEMIIQKISHTYIMKRMIVGI